MVLYPRDAGGCLRVTLYARLIFVCVCTFNFPAFVSTAALLLLCSPRKSCAVQPQEELFGLLNNKECIYMFHGIWSTSLCRKCLALPLVNLLAACFFNPYRTAPTWQNSCWRKAMR